MREQLEILLRFNVKASDGVVTGYGRMSTFIQGELPRIGDRIRPCTGQSDINLLMDYYSLDVIGVCRNVGGAFTEPVLCEITLSTWNTYSGKNEINSRTQKQVISDWKTLAKVYKSRTWRPDSQEGIVIVTLYLMETFIQ